MLQMIGIDITHCPDASIASGADTEMNGTTLLTGKRLMSSKEDVLNQSQACPDNILN